MLTVKYKQITNNTDDDTIFVNYTFMEHRKNNIDIFFYKLIYSIY